MKIILNVESRTIQIAAECNGYKILTFSSAMSYIRSASTIVEYQDDETRVFPDRVCFEPMKYIGSKKVWFICNQIKTPEDVILDHTSILTQDISIPESKCIAIMPDYYTLDDDEDEEGRNWLVGEYIPQDLEYYPVFSYEVIAKQYFNREDLIEHLIVVDMESEGVTTSLIHNGNLVAVDICEYLNHDSWQEVLSEYVIDKLSKATGMKHPEIRRELDVKGLIQKLSCLDYMRDIVQLSFPEFNCEIEFDINDENIEIEIMLHNLVSRIKRCIKGYSIDPKKTEI